jgi:Sulfotransferase family
MDCEVVISDDPPFIFVHIPKTGGVSLSETLAPEGRRNHPWCLTTKHETWAQFQSRVGPDKLAKHFSFALVRHPLERLVSLFRYLKTHPGRFPSVAGIATLDQFAEAISNDDHSIIGGMRSILSQRSFVEDVTGKRCLPTFRFEDVYLDPHPLFARLNIPARPLPRKNVSRVPRPDVSDDVRRFVEDRYAVDFATFGY